MWPVTSNYKRNFSKVYNTKFNKKKEIKYYAQFYIELLYNFLKFTYGS